MKYPSARALMISACAARVMARNKVGPGQLFTSLVKEACRRAEVNWCRGISKSPMVTVHLRNGDGLYPGLYDRWRYKGCDPSFRSFRYSAGGDRILYRGMCDKYHYSETMSGRVQLAVATDWLPESVCASISGAGHRINDIMVDEGYFFQVSNPLVIRARNGFHRRQRAVILTLKVDFSTSYWEEVCPPK